MAYLGYPFGPQHADLILAVWLKGRKVRGYDPADIRQDMCGHWIQFDQHGKESNYGWEIDHILPRAKGGKTELANLQPLWWEYNRRKGDTYPWDGT